MIGRIVVLLLLGSGTAVADELSTYVANLATNPRAAASYLESCDMLVAPNGDVRRPCTFEFTDLGGKPGMTLVASAPKVHQLEKSPFEWHEADVELREGKKVVAKFRVLEVHNAMRAPGRASQPIVVHWVKPIADNAASTLAKAGTLPAPKPIKDAIAPPPKQMTDETDRNDRQGGVDSMKSRLALHGKATDDVANWVDGGATVVGSGPNERYTGKAGAKALRAWPVTLSRTGGLVVASVHKQLIYGAFAITATMKDKPPITFVGLAISTQHLTGGGSFGASLALVSFGVAN
jgi:hypothetical protein